MHHPDIDVSSTANRGSKFIDLMFAMANIAIIVAMRTFIRPRGIEEPKGIETACRSWSDNKLSPIGMFMSNSCESHINLSDDYRSSIKPSSTYVVGLSSCKLLFFSIMQQSIYAPYDLLGAFAKSSKNTDSKHANKINIFGLLAGESTQQTANQLTPGQNIFGYSQGLFPSFVETINAISGKNYIKFAGITAVCKETITFMFASTFGMKAAYFKLELFNYTSIQNISMRVFCSSGILKHYLPMLVYTNI